VISLAVLHVVTHGPPSRPTSLGRIHVVPALEVVHCFGQRLPSLLGEAESERYVTLFEQLAEHAVFDHGAADLAREIAEDYRRLPG
jgi:hypothetical protein